MLKKVSCQDIIENDVSKNVSVIATHWASY